MNPITAIRKNVLKASQAEMAAIAGTTQATVSRWERGELKPDIDQLSRIRTEALARGIEWDNGWLFQSAPTADAPPATEPKRKRGKAA